MKIILNRTEINQALECYLKKRGISMETYATEISSTKATVTIDPTEEDLKDDEAVMENHQEMDDNRAEPEVEPEPEPAPPIFGS